MQDTKFKNLKSKLNKNQIKLRKLFNKCLAFNKDIKNNKVNDLMDIKPMIGIQASNFEKIIGKTTNSDVKKKQVIKLNLK